MGISRKKEINEFQKIYKLVDRICKKHKGCNRSNIFHALMCLKKPPIKRLEMSIRRANISIFSKRYSGSFRP